MTLFTRRFFLKAAVVTTAALAAPVPFDEVEMDVIMREDGALGWQWYRITDNRLEPLLGETAARYRCARAGLYACQMTSKEYTRESTVIQMVAGDEAEFRLMQRFEMAG